MKPSIPAILLRDLHKNYGKVRALQGVDLEVQPGEIFGFLGPNGAGKTTTIRCLLDLIRPAGCIFFQVGTPLEADNKVDLRPINKHQNFVYL